MPALPGPSTAPSVVARSPGIAGMPGVRTLRSPGFRLLLACVITLIGVLALGAAMLRQASQPGGQFGIDFADYYGAARAIAAGDSPYAPEMLLGPIDAQGLERYRYPPPLAQLLVPLTALPQGAAAIVWLLLQAVVTVAALWLALGVAGVPRRAERLAWSAAACVVFMPVFDALWKGNVSGFVAFQVGLVAIGGALAGLGVVSATILKVAPVAMIPAIGAAGRRAMAGGALTGIGVVGVSWLLAPDAWTDYARVLPNLLAGSADYPTNLAPAATLDRLGVPAPLVGAARLVTLAVALGCAAAAPLVARRRPGVHGWAAATILGVAAMLLLPAACWYHYLVVLLPIAALSWPAAGTHERISMLAAAALVSLGVAFLPAATTGAVMLVVVALHVQLRAPLRRRPEL